MKKIFIDLNSLQQKTKSPPKITTPAKQQHPTTHPALKNNHNHDHTFTKLIINTQHLLTNNSHILNSDSISSNEVTFFEHINRHQTLHIQNQINRIQQNHQKTLFDGKHYEEGQMPSGSSKQSSQYINYLKQYNSLIKSRSRLKSVSPLKQKQQMSLLIKQFLQDIDPTQQKTSQATPNSNKQPHTSHKKYHTPSQQVAQITIDLIDRHKTTENNTKHPKNQQPSSKITPKVKQHHNKSSHTNNNNKLYQQKYSNIAKQLAKQEISPQKPEQPSSSCKSKYIQLHMKKKQVIKYHPETDKKKMLTKVIQIKQNQKKAIQISIDIDESMLSGIKKNNKSKDHDQIKSQGDQIQKEQLISQIKWKIKELLSKQTIIKR